MWRESYLCDVNAGFLLVTEYCISGNRYKGLGIQEPHGRGPDGRGTGVRERDLIFQFSP